MSSKSFCAASLSVLFATLATADAAATSRSGGPGQRSLCRVGTGTPGTGGVVPRLWATTTPRPGEASFGFELDRGLGGGFGAVLLSLGSANLNLGGLRLLVDPGRVIFAPSFALAGAGPGGGSATQPLPLPNDPGLLGFSLWAQGIVVDPAGGFVGIAASPALRIVPKASALLLATRSIGGSTDPVDAIDLLSMARVNINAGAVNNGAGVAFTVDETRAAVCSGLTDTVAFYDTSVFPPTLVSSTPTSDTPWTIAMHPDGVRGYVVTQGPSGSQPQVEVLNVDPADPAFGMPHSAGGFPAGTIDALEILFLSDGSLGFISCLGLGHQPALTRFDATLGSSTYHQALGQATFTGFLMSTTISNDDSRVFVAAASLGSFAEVQVIDTATLMPIDQDPGTPGVQHIGGELSFPATPLGRVIGGIVSDPRDRFLYISVWGSPVNDARLIQLDMDPESPTFRSSVVYNTGLMQRAQMGALAISDAGDRLYLAVTGQNEIHEIDTATMTQLRTFNVPSSPNNLALR